MEYDGVVLHRNEIEICCNGIVACYGNGSCHEMKWKSTEMEVDDQDGVAVKQLAALLPLARAVSQSVTNTDQHSLYPPHPADKQTNK